MNHQLSYLVLVIYFCISEQPLETYSLKALAFLYFFAEKENKKLTTAWLQTDEI